MQKINSIDENLNTNKLKILNIDLSFKDPFKFKLAELKQHIFKSFDLAHKLALNNKKLVGLSTAL